MEAYSPVPGFDAPGASLADFDAGELIQMQLYLRGVHERYEAIWYLRESGSLPDEVWHRYRRILGQASRIRSTDRSGMTKRVRVLLDSSFS